MSTDSSSDRDPVERLAEEFLERRRRGEDATRDEYAERYPEWAGRIREAFEAVEMLERLKPASGEGTGSFDDEGDNGEESHPKRLGDYRIIRKIGHGGMGVVYEAVQESLGRHVALKVLPTHGRGDTIHMERFRLEARSAARLHHTHIVPVYGVGEHGGVHYYAMQFIQGCGLDAVLDDLRRLRPDASTVQPRRVAVTQREAALSRAAAETLLAGGSAEPRDGAVSDTPPPRSDGSGLSGHTEPRYHRSVARIGVQVAEALAHAHGQGVLHRDIKPSNLLLDADGEAWVTDFGLAKVEEGEGLTQTGDVVGTLRYMAPERFDGWSDPRSDVYGLGITLYEMVTLRPAHDAVNRARLIERVLEAAPPAPRKVDPRIPRDLETIVLKAIAKEPGARYATAKALSEDLQNYLSGKPIKARRVGLPERAWRWGRRNPAAAGLVGASAIAILAMVAIAVGSVYHLELQNAYRDKDSALENEKVAHTNEVRARKDEAEIRYFNNILMAEREWNNNHARRAEQLLNDCLPKEGESDLRGWEWHYLNRQGHAEIKTLDVHASQLFAVAFSPDARRFVSSDMDDKNGNGLTLRDAETGKLIYTLRGHSGETGGVAFSPDSKLVATTSGVYSKPGEVKIWLTETGQEWRSFPGETWAAARTAFSPDGKRLAAVTGSPSRFNSLIVWEVETRKVLVRRIIEKTEMGLVDVAFSPDGNRIATATGKESSVSTEDRPGVVTIRDSRTGDEIITLKGHVGPLTSVAYGPDGRRIATAGWDNTLRIWNADTGQELRVLRGHFQLPRNVVFSPDGRRLASASEDNSAKVWDAGTGEELFTLRGHTRELCSVVYVDSGRSLVTASQDGVLKFWDAETGKEALNLGTLSSPDQTVLSRDLRTAERVQSIPRRSPWVNSASFSPDGLEVATASSDKIVRVFDSSTGRILATFPEQDDVVWDVAYSRGGNYIATAGGHWIRPETPGEVTVWDAVTRTRLWGRTAHAGLVRAVAFSPDGTRLATTGGEQSTEPGFIRIWDVKTAKEVLSAFRGHSKGLNAVSYSPDGRLLASGGWDNTVKIWDAETGRTIRDLVGHSQAVFSVAFSPDGKHLASTSWDGIVRVWDVATGQVKVLYRGHKAGVLSAAFSPDGKRVVSGGDDYTVKVWEATTGREALTLRGHKDRVWRVSFSPDGLRIASASQDGTVKIWDGTPWIEPPTRNSPSSQVRGSR